MTSKTLRTKSGPWDLLSTTHPFAVGIDRLLDDLYTVSGANSTGYPPYNITKISRDQEPTEYEITAAVAGFTQDDIEIVLEKNVLKISGTSGVLAHDADAQVDYLHKGIAERNFERKFHLSDHIQVTDANLRDGILRVRLAEIVPEELKPKHIEIKS